MSSILPIPPNVLDGLLQQSKECITRLVESSQYTDLSSYSLSQLAAVLVLLYESAGQLRVLLTTRSKALRTHAGQTALPGGRMDALDKNFIDTAYREAFEEVALPLHSPHIHTLCILEPFMSMHKLIVTPVVAFLTEPAVLTDLRASDEEVSEIFTHPLEALLDPTLARSEPLVPSGTEHWLYNTELHNTTDVVIDALDNAAYRMHRFRSMASPIKGLTADILIKTAEIAYQRKPCYDRSAPGQEHGFAHIRRILQGQKDIIERPRSPGP